MNRSLFARPSHLSRGLFTFAILALTVGVGFHSHILSRIQAQEPVRTATNGPSADGKELRATANETFLVLASTVGQSAAAERLIDFKQKYDPASRQRYFAIVDFSKPSTSKRLFIFDTLANKVENYYVAHGRGSGENFAERFSNLSGSNSSSLGIYKTLNEYNGQHGRSLRLEGLERTNSNAQARAVVMHTADYVSESFIRRTGRLGRSEGCFAVERSVGDKLIDELKDGAYIIAVKN
jgi:hypothetical protein